MSVAKKINLAIIGIPIDTLHHLQCQGNVLIFQKNCMGADFGSFNELCPLLYELFAGFVLWMGFVTQVFKIFLYSFPSERSGR